MMSIASGSISSKKGRKGQDNSNQSVPLDQLHSASGHSVLLDEESEEDEDYQSPEPEEEVGRLHVYKAFFFLNSTYKC